MNNALEFITCQSFSVSFLWSWFHLVIGLTSILLQEFVTLVFQYLYSQAFSFFKQATNSACVHRISCPVLWHWTN